MSGYYLINKLLVFLIILNKASISTSLYGSIWIHFTASNKKLRLGEPICFLCFQMAPHPNSEASLHGQSFCNQSSITKLSSDKKDVVRCPAFWKLESSSESNLKAPFRQIWKKKGLGQTWGPQIHNCKLPSAFLGQPLTMEAVPSLMGRFPKYLQVCFLQERWHSSPS